MKLIVGLGNPGKKYINTRHNLGFKVIDELAGRFEARLKRKLFGSARQAQFGISDNSLMIIQPLTFMNLSGVCLAQYVNKYNFSLDDILVICDDINLPLGQIRLRAQGASGGHQGLESIIRSLESKSFPRLRVGVGREEPVSNFKEFILSDFEKDEVLKVKEALHCAAEASLCWMREGVDKAMSIYNVNNA